VQKRSLEKLARLKSAGLALYGEKGYENSSIDEISRRAKLAVGTFYQHFRSKRQLLLALMDELLEKLSLLDFRAAAMTDVRTGIRELMSRAFSHDLRYLGAYRGLAQAMDSFFWSLLAQAAQLSKAELRRSIDAATHLIYHAIFTDSVHRARKAQD
jgi:AcrR family transcriptional regulator